MVWKQIILQNFQITPYIFENGPIRIFKHTLKFSKSVEFKLKPSIYYRV